MSKAEVDKDEGGPQAALPMPAVPVVPDDSGTIKPAGSSSDSQPPAHAKGAPESMTEEQLYEAFEVDYQARRRQAMAELSHDG